MYCGGFFPHHPYVTYSYVYVRKVTSLLLRRFLRYLYRKLYTVNIYRTYWIVIRFKPFSRYILYNVVHHVYWFCVGQLKIVRVIMMMFVSVHGVVTFR